MSLVAIGIDARGHFLGDSPLGAAAARQPNAYVVITFLRASKPRGQDVPVAKLDDSRSVAGRERSGFIDEFALHGPFLDVGLGQMGLLLLRCRPSGDRPEQDARQTTPADAVRSPEPADSRLVNVHATCYPLRVKRGFTSVLHFLAAAPGAVVIGQSSVRKGEAGKGGAPAAGEQ